MDFRLYNAIAILYFSQVAGSYALGLAVFSFQTISSSLFELPTGVLSDRVGRRVTVVLGQAFTALAVLAYALGGSFVVLAVGGALEGVARAFFSGNNDALLYDTLRETGEEGRFSELQGKTSSMFQVALALSAFVGAFTLTMESFRYLFWLSVIPQIAGLILAFFLVEPKSHSEKYSSNVFAHLGDAFKRFKENARLRTLSIANVLDYGLGEPVHEFFPAFSATIWPPWAVALARGCGHVFGAIGYRVSGMLIKRFGAIETMLGVGGVSYTISTVIIAFPTVLTPAIKSFTSFAFGVGSVAQSSVLQKEFSNEQRATMGSINSLAGSLFFGIGAYLLGLLADAVGLQYAMLSAQVLSIVSLLLYWRLYRRGVASGATAGS